MLLAGGEPGDEANIVAVVVKLTVEHSKDEHTKIEN